MYLDLSYLFAKRLIPAALLLMTVLVFHACSPARYVPKDDYLLSKNKVENTQKKAITEDQLRSYLLQKPNKKILGVRFHLFLYNLSDIKKNRWPHNWLRRIGEEPVVYSSDLTKASRDQLKQFLENKGYYHALVSDTVTYRGRNARVTYRIDPKKPYVIRSIRYFFEDTSIRSQILPDTINSLLKRGKPFDKDVLQNERIRIESLMKENGYFRFSKEYIYFTATLDVAHNAVDLLMGFKQFVEGKPDPVTGVKRHRKYIINNVFISSEYGGTITGAEGNGITVKLDTVKYHDLYFLIPGRFTIKPAVISYFNYIVPGQYYKLSNVNKTYRNLSELGPIRFTNISFREDDSLVNAGADKLLDCNIGLSRKKVQSYQTEIDGTNSGGDLGVRGNLTYQNLNLFRGAEVFNLRFTGAIEALKNRLKKQLQFSSLKEIGVESSIVFPKFFSPIRFGSFVRKYAPKTSISGSFNYQSRPDYTRSIANASFSYKWNGTPYLTHTIWPMEINYVQLYENRSSTTFLDSIRATPLGYSFEDHLVNVARYGLELNNQSIGHSRDFVFLRINLESAGNLVYVSDRLFHASRINGQYHLLNVPYFQYMRGDFDFRYYNIIDKQNKIAYRIYAGMGIPYGNSQSMPFEKKFFSGGPNSIRAWPSRDLGPGSDTTRNLFFNFPNKNGDIKLEANIEYRFKVIWKMEGAIFLDAGNIWNQRPDPSQPGADFQWNRFIKETAVGTGLGARFDFSFFLLRADFGLKLHDPALPEGHRWIPVFSHFSLRDWHLNFGIGYPF